jgi:hypothetical protein
MVTKQLNLSLQAQNLPESTNNMEISLNGVTVYTGSVPETGPIITGGDSYTTTTISFDIDVPVATANSLTSTMTFSATVAGGNVQIERISTNYNYTLVNTGTEEAPVWEAVAGTDKGFITTNITSQPLWDGIALLDRYNIEYNNGPIQFTGPGEVLINNDENVEFSVNVNNFNDSLPLPT